MTNITAIAAAFEPTKTEAATWYADRVRRIFASFADEQGVVYKPKRSAMYNDERLRNRWAGCSPYVRYEGGREQAPVTLTEDYLAKKAAEFGEDQVAGFIAKLTRKLGEMDSVELRSLGDGSFTITGTLNGHKVRVDQTVVFKVSNKGTFFLQWPARIYVDGQFTPEAKFAAATA